MCTVAACAQACWEASSKAPRPQDATSTDKLKHLPSSDLRRTLPQAEEGPPGLGQSPQHLLAQALNTPQGSPPGGGSPAQQALLPPSPNMH